jgi:hypothetical protein
VWSFARLEKFKTNMRPSGKPKQYGHRIFLFVAKNKAVMRPRFCLLLRISFSATSFLTHYSKHNMHLGVYNDPDVESFSGFQLDQSKDICRIFSRKTLFDRFELQ